LNKLKAPSGAILHNSKTHIMNNTTHNLAIKIMEAFDEQGLTITFGEAFKIASSHLNDNKYRLNLEAFEGMLMSHDWYYERSDDHRKYKRGSAQRDAIYELAYELGDTPEARKLWDEHCPTAKPYPVDTQQLRK